MSASVRRARLAAVLGLPILLLALLLQPPTAAAEAGPEEVVPEPEYLRARILELGETTETDLGYGMIIYTQPVTLVVTSGAHKGLELTFEHHNPGDVAFQIPLAVGREVLLSAFFDGAEVSEAYIEDIVRDRHLLWLGAVFLGCLVLVGGGKGLRAGITLGLTILGVFKVLLPGLLAGHSPIFLSVLVAAGAASITLLAVGGFRPKTLAAIIGTTGGVVAAGFLARYVGAVAQLTGFSAEETQMLLYIPQGIEFDFQGLLFAGMLIGALGAVMDVGMSVASAIEEVWRANPAQTPRSLFRSGMNVGRDVIGTMSNTLVLAYTGGAIPLLLLFMAYELPLARVINLDLVATEVVRAFTGSIGLVLAIPVTAAAAGVLVAMQPTRGRHGVRPAPGTGGARAAE